MPKTRANPRNETILIPDHPLEPAKTCGSKPPTPRRQFSLPLIAGWKPNRPKAPSMAFGKGKRRHFCEGPLLQLCPAESWKSAGQGTRPTGEGWFCGTVSRSVFRHPEIVHAGKVPGLRRGDPVTGHKQPPGTVVSARLKMSLDPHPDNDCLIVSMMGQRWNVRTGS